jgi:hypothetical protein
VPGKHPYGTVHTPEAQSRPAVGQGHVHGVFELQAGESLQRVALGPEKSVALLRSMLKTWLWRHPVSAVDLGSAHWRMSSFSGNNGTCVEIASLAHGRVAVRNSNNPSAGTIYFNQAEMRAYVESVKAGQSDLT